MNDLRNIDLNLLVILRVLLAEKHVTRAASRLYKSQPAVSHALAHLRRIFNDPLLVARAGKLELTHRAQELIQPLDEALNQINGLIAPREFDAAQAERVFRVAMSDYGAHVVLPGLVRRLRAEAPHIDLVISQGSRESMLVEINDGEIDLALGVFPDPRYETVRTQTLFQEHFLCVADGATLPENGEMTLAAWLARPHVLAASRFSIDNEVDRALARENQTRRVSLVLPHWGVADAVIAGTDLILTVASRSLRMYRSDATLCTFAPPLVIPPFDFSMIWQRRRDGDPAHLWLRELVFACAQQEPGRR